MRVAWIKFKGLANSFVPEEMEMKTGHQSLKLRLIKAPVGFNGERGEEGARASNDQNDVAWARSDKGNQVAVASSTNPTTQPTTVKQHNQNVKIWRAKRPSYQTVREEKIAERGTAQKMEEEGAAEDSKNTTDESKRKVVYGNTAVEEEHSCVGDRSREMGCVGEGSSGPREGLLETNAYFETGPTRHGKEDKTEAQFEGEGGPKTKGYIGGPELEPKPSLNGDEVTIRKI